MATQHIINGPVLVGGDATSEEGEVTLTVGSDDTFDMWYRASTGLITRIAPPSGSDADYALQIVRSGGSNVAPTWQLLPEFNNRAISVVHPGFDLDNEAGPVVVGFTGTDSWTAASSPFFDDSNGSFDFAVGAGGGVYTVASGYGGIYEITATVTWDNTVNRGSRTLRILVNGSPVTQAVSIIQANSNNSISVSQTASTAVALSATGTLSIDVEQDTDSTVTLSSANLVIRHV